MSIDPASEPQEHPPTKPIPLALIYGQPVLHIPQDLYIPPDALEVVLKSFEGPLDLLLYLIRRQHLDILDIPVAEITRQYMHYITLMHDVVQLEMAAEYLLMAAILGEIKSRLLLPPPPVEETVEEDPRAELVRRLQEYERFKKAAREIDALPRLERDRRVVRAAVEHRQVIKPPPLPEPAEIVLALRHLLVRAELFDCYAIKREMLSVRQRMNELLDSLNHVGFSRFETLLNRHEGRQGVIVTFLAILELARDAQIVLLQENPIAPIYLKSQ